MRSALPIAIVACLVSILAACSTGKQGSRTSTQPIPQPIYRPSRSIPCLNVVGTVKLPAEFNADPEITEELDSIGEAAGLKAIDLNLRSNSAEVIFEKSASKARKTAATASFWAKNYRSRAVIVRRRNVVVIFRKHPNADERNAVFGCMNTSRPAAKALLLKLKATMRADHGSGGICWNGCSGLRIPEGRVSVVRPDYVAVDAGEPIDGGSVNWVSVIFHHDGNRWGIVDYGTAEVGCERVPPRALRDLGFACPFY